MLAPNFTFRASILLCHFHFYVKEKTNMRLSSQELRHSFLTFCEKHGHVIIPSASLIPEHDPSVLFTNAGMHPLIPYLSGQTHPGGQRLANIQKCLRTGDIEEVGDQSHLTFFEMLGFWSLGDYWKQDSLRWTLEWFTDELGLERERISVTVFAGDQDVVRDEEAAQIWQTLGIPSERIYYLPKADNWWTNGGSTGLCGPDSELFYDTHRPVCGPHCQPGCSCGKYIEIGNNVFILYERTSAGTLVPLAQRNIDVGIGLERLLCVLSDQEDVYSTDLFAPIIQCIEQLRIQQSEQVASSMSSTQRLTQIIADHVRAATFLLADDVRPSNTERGYVCRRLIRRAVRSAHELELPGRSLAQIVEVIIAYYRQYYPELEQRSAFILAEMEREEERFTRTLARGLHEFQKAAECLRQNQQVQLAGKDIFRLFDTFGFPPSLTVELAQEQGLQVDLASFQQLFQEQQARSRQANQNRFARRD
jgi:alanyl-tRNA synthetase